MNRHDAPESQTGPGAAQERVITESEITQRLSINTVTQDQQGDLQNKTGSAVRLNRLARGWRETKPTKQMDSRL